MGGDVDDAGAQRDAQRILRAGERLAVGPQVELRGDGRDLDRDVVDVGPLHQGHQGVAPAPGLLMAEHGLAQQVDVHAEALGAQPGQMATQRGILRVGHQLTDDGAASAGGPVAPPCQEGPRTGGHPSAGGRRRPARGRRAWARRPGGAAGGRPRGATRAAAPGHRRPWRRRPSPDQKSARAGAGPGRVRTGWERPTRARAGPGPTPARPGSPPAGPARAPDPPAVHRGCSYHAVKQPDRPL